MRPGQSAEIATTFYSGKEYRVLVCGQPVLGEVTFKVLEAKTRNVLFDSSNHDASFWDFKIKNTTEVLIEVNVEGEENPSEIQQSGCVSVVIGFK